MVKRFLVVDRCRGEFNKKVPVVDRGSGELNIIKEVSSVDRGRGELNLVKKVSLIERERSWLKPGQESSCMYISVRDNY